MSKAKQKVEMFPDEIYLNAAIKDGRAVKKELSMKAIGTPDVRLQQRVKTDVNHVRLLEGILRDGEQLRAIIVFEDDDGKFHVADGFHRHGAHVNFDAPSIWAWVIKGSWRDAMIYSTMCNRNLCLKRTKDDIKKAVMTLFDDEEWWGMSDSAVGDHCGASSTIVGKCRAEHSMARGVPIPEMVKTSNGIIRPYRNKAIYPRIRKAKSGRGVVCLYAYIDGVKTPLGSNYEEAKKKIDAKLAENRNRKWDLKSETTLLHLRRSGLLFKAGNLKTGLGLGNISAGHGVVFTPETFSRGKGGGPSIATPSAVGRVLLARQLVDPSARAVVVCYAEDAPPELIEAGRAIGVEFLTPEELVASIKDKGRAAS